MTLCDAVGRLFWGVCKNGAVHHGLFFAGASCTSGACCLGSYPGESPVF